MKKMLVVLLVLASTAVWAQPGVHGAEGARVQSATLILEQIMEAPDRAIPDSILEGAKCIAIVPSMLKAGFIIGANYGKGVATCRTEKGWSSPTFFRMEGGSFGFQAGGEASDLVLIVRTDEGMQYMLQSKFKLGADASAAAGPVGRDTQAMTDLTMRAEVLTYSRSRGLFAGVAVNGAVVKQDEGATEAYYGKNWTFYSLLHGEVPPPEYAQPFLNTVEKYSPTRRASLHAAPAPATEVSTPAPTTSRQDPAPGTDPSAAPPASTEPTQAPAVPADPASKPGDDSL